MATINVHVVNPDRKVVVSEFHADHPGDNPEGNEAWVVGYPGEANIYEVGDTPLVRQRIAEGLLELAGAAKLLDSRSTSQAGSDSDPERQEEQKLAAQRQSARAERDRR